MRANTNLIAVIRSVKYQLWSICTKLHHLMIAKWIADQSTGWNGLQLVCDCWRRSRHWAEALILNSCDMKSVASLTDWWKTQHTLSVIFDKIGDADKRKQNRRFVAKYNKEKKFRTAVSLTVATGNQNHPDFSSKSIYKRSNSTLIKEGEYGGMSCLCSWPLFYSSFYF